MSAYLKTIDPKHLVTVGEEGFYGPDESKSDDMNPGSGWATLTGQNFIKNHAPPGIDFLGVHLWPDNWNVRSCLPIY